MEVAGRRAFWNDRIGGGGGGMKGEGEVEMEGGREGTYAAQFLTNCRPRIGQRWLTQCDAEEGFASTDLSLGQQMTPILSAAFSRIKLIA